MRRVLQSRFARFSLRAMLLAVTGGSVALAVWRMPFDAEVKDLREFAFCPMGMSGDQMEQASREIDALRETGRVYRDFHGNRIKHGVATLYNGNGAKIRERHWVHGQLEGTETNWAPNGEVTQQTRYRGGKRHGWESLGNGQLWYYENDELIFEESWGPDGKHVDEYHSDGSRTWTLWSHGAEKLREVAYDRHHLRQGPTTLYHDNGRIRCEGAWRDDLEQGPWTWWDAQGKPVRQVKFDRGIVQRPGGRKSERPYVREDDRSCLISHEAAQWLWALSGMVSDRAPMTDVVETMQDVFTPSGRPGQTSLFRLHNDDVRRRLENARAPDGVETLPLRDGLIRSFAPLGLQVVMYDDGVWVVDHENVCQLEGAIPLTRVMPRNACGTLQSARGLRFGRCTLATVIDWLTGQKVPVRLDPERIENPDEVLAREVDADIPGCTVGAALEIVLNQLGLTYFADDDHFQIVPLAEP